MFRKKWFLTITTLLLLTGAAFAQNGTDDSSGSDAHEECEAERQEAYADAEEDYQEERDEAESEEDNASAEQERKQERAEADEEYRECIADHEEERDEEESDDSDSLPIPDSYNGEHIAFDVTASGAANYTVDGVLVLSSVSADQDAAWEEYRLREPSVKLEGDSSGTGSGVELKAADVESGVFVFEADGSITVVFPEGVNVTAGYHAEHHDDDDSDEDPAAECESEYQEELADAEEERDEAIAEGDNETEAREEYAEAVADAEKEREECLADAREEDDEDEDDSDFLTLKGDGFQAVLYTEEGYSLDGQTLTTTEEIRLILTDGDTEGLSKESTKGIADGQIAAGIDVPRRGAPTAAEYGDVEVTVESTDDGLLATVDSDNPEGRTILFTLEEGALDLGSLTVLFDNETITQADDMADLRDTSDGAEYVIILGAQGAEVLVQVPHFSVHTIELQSDEASVAIPAPGVAALAVGVLGLAAAVQAVRRR